MKVNGDVIAVAKIVAAYRQISLAEYLSVVLEPIVNADLEAEQEKRMAMKGKGNGRKGS